MPAPDISIAQVLPPGPTVLFALWGDGLPADADGGSAGWTPVDRPRRKAFSEYLGTPLYSMSLPLTLDGADHDAGIGPDLSVVKGWRLPTTATGEPAVLVVRGPVPLTDLRWTLKSLSWGPGLRRRDGETIQQQLTLELLEYSTPSLAFTSAAQRAQARQQTGTTSGTTSAGGHRTYVVKKGDTLTTIAARVLGNWRRWADIGALNGIKDPKAVHVGQTLRLP